MALAFLVTNITFLAAAGRDFMNGTHLNVDMLFALLFPKRIVKSLHYLLILTVFLSVLQLGNVPVKELFDFGLF